MIQSRPPLYYLILLFIITLLSFSYYKTSHKFSISSTANTKSNFNNYHDDLKTTTTKNNKLKSKIFKSRTVAIGDLHGDLPHALKVLTIAGLIDSDTNWIGGETTLVQTGDIVDRGKDTQTLYHLMDSLRVQAAAAGGGLYSLLGNHELMNALNDLRYVTSSDIATFKGGIKERQEVMKEGWIGQTWRKNYRITARVPFYHRFEGLPEIFRKKVEKSKNVDVEEEEDDQPFFHDLLLSSSSSSSDPNPFTQSAASFVHGGITPLYLSTLSPSSPITSINNLGSSLLLKILSSPPNSHGVPSTSTAEERYFYGAEGPVWDRTFALEEDEVEVCRLAEESCKRLGVRHLIMGHTPNFDGIVSRCKGKILLIDTGISRAYGGTLSSLEILYTLIPREELTISESQAIPEELKDSKKNKNLWLEREIVSALYEDRKEELVKNERFLNLPW